MDRGQEHTVSNESTQAEDVIHLPAREYISAEDKDLLKGDKIKFPLELLPRFYERDINENPFTIYIDSLRNILPYELEKSELGDRKFFHPAIDRMLGDAIPKFINGYPGCIHSSMKRKEISLAEYHELLFSCLEPFYEIVESLVSESLIDKKNVSTADLLSLTFCDQNNKRVFKSLGHLVTCAFVMEQGCAGVFTEMAGRLKQKLSWHNTASSPAMMLQRLLKKTKVEIGPKLSRQKSIFHTKPFLHLRTLNKEFLPEKGDLREVLKSNPDIAIEALREFYFQLFGALPRWLLSAKWFTRRIKEMLSLKVSDEKGSSELTIKELFDLASGGKFSFGWEDTKILKSLLIKGTASLGRSTDIKENSFLEEGSSSSVLAPESLPIRDTSVKWDDITPGLIGLKEFRKCRPDERKFLHPALDEIIRARYPEHVPGKPGCIKFADSNQIIKVNIKEYSAILLRYLEPFYLITESLIAKNLIDRKRLTTADLLDLKFVDSDNNVVFESWAHFVTTAFRLEQECTKMLRRMSQWIKAKQYWVDIAECPADMLERLVNRRVPKPEKYKAQRFDKSKISLQLRALDQDILPGSDDNVDLLHNNKDAAILALREFYYQLCACIPEDLTKAFSYADIKNYNFIKVSSTNGKRSIAIRNLIYLAGGDERNLNTIASSYSLRSNLSGYKSSAVEYKALEEVNKSYRAAAPSRPKYRKIEPDEERISHDLALDVLGNHKMDLHFQFSIPFKISEQTSDKRVRKALRDYHQRLLQPYFNTRMLIEDMGFSPLASDNFSTAGRSDLKCVKSDGRVIYESPGQLLFAASWFEYHAQVLYEEKARLCGVKVSKKKEVLSPLLTLYKLHEVRPGAARQLQIMEERIESGRGVIFAELHALDIDRQHWKYRGRLGKIKEDKKVYKDPELCLKALQEFLTQIYGHIPKEPYSKCFTLGGNLILCDTNHHREVRLASLIESVLSNFDSVLKNETRDEKLFRLLSLEEKPFQHHTLDFFGKIVSARRAEDPDGSTVFSNLSNLVADLIAEGKLDPDNFSTASLSTLKFTNSKNQVTRYSFGGLLSIEYTYTQLISIEYAQEQSLLEFLSIRAKIKPGKLGLDLMKSSSPRELLSKLVALHHPAKAKQKKLYQNKDGRIIYFDVSALDIDSQEGENLSREKRARIIYKDPNRCLRALREFLLHSPEVEWRNPFEYFTKKLDLNISDTQDRVDVRIDKLLEIVLGHFKNKTANETENEKLLRLFNIKSEEEASIERQKRAAEEQKRAIEKQERSKKHTERVHYLAQEKNISSATLFFGLCALNLEKDNKKAYKDFGDRIIKSKTLPTEASFSKESATEIVAEIIDIGVEKSTEQGTSINYGALFKHRISDLLRQIVQRNHGNNVQAIIDELSKFETTIDSTRDRLGSKLIRKVLSEVCPELSHTLKEEQEYEKPATIKANLFPNQREAVVGALKFVKPLEIIGTAGGKTIVCATVAESFDTKKVLWCTHAANTVETAEKLLERVLEGKPDILEDIENVRKAPGGKINIHPENLSQSRSGFVSEPDTSLGGVYIGVLDRTWIHAKPEELSAFLEEHKYIVAGYTTLLWIQKSSPENFKLLRDWFEDGLRILDEAEILDNHNGKISSCVQALLSKKDTEEVLASGENLGSLELNRTIIATATPFQHRDSRIATILHLALPYLHPDIEELTKKFQQQPGLARKYMRMYSTMYGVNDMAKPLEDPKKIPFAKQLADGNPRVSKVRYHRETVELSTAHAEAYVRLATNYDKSAADYNLRLGSLRQYAALRRLLLDPESLGLSPPKELINKVKEIALNDLRQGKKVIILGYRKPILNLLSEDLELAEFGLCLLSGDVDISDRKDKVKRFENSNDLNCAIVQVNAAGRGHDMRCDRMIFIDLPPLTSTIIQARGRGIRPVFPGDEHLAREFVDVTFIDPVLPKIVVENIAEPRREKYISRGTLYSQSLDRDLVRVVDYEYNTARGARENKLSRISTATGLMQKLRRVLKTFPEIDDETKLWKHQRKVFGVYENAVKDSWHREEEAFVRNQVGSLRKPVEDLVLAILPGPGAPEIPFYLDLGIKAENILAFERGKGQRLEVVRESVEQYGCQLIESSVEKGILSENREIDIFALDPDGYLNANLFEMLMRAKLADDALILKNALRSRENATASKMIDLADGSRVKLDAFLMKLVGTSSLESNALYSNASALKALRAVSFARIAAAEIAKQLSSIYGFPIAGFTDLLSDLYLGSSHVQAFEQLKYISPGGKSFLSTFTRLKKWKPQVLETASAIELRKFIASSVANIARTADKDVVRKTFSVASKDENILAIRHGKASALILVEGLVELWEYYASRVAPEHRFTELLESDPPTIKLLK